MNPLTTNSSQPDPIGNVQDSSVSVESQGPIASSGRSALFIGAFLPLSQGTRGISEDLSIRMASTGWQVLITSRRSGRVSRLVDMLRTCWQRRRQYKVAIVDLYSGPAFWGAKAVCWVLGTIGKPYVLVLHGGSLPKFAERWKTSVRALLTSAVAVTAPSHYLFDQMQSYRKDLQLLPNAINISAYRFKHRPGASARLIWLRAFHQIYNPEMAIQVVALLKQEFPEIHLTMIGPDKGDGSLRSTLHTAERLGVTPHLTLLGAVSKDKVPEKLNGCDIFINTSRTDNTPVSVLEAMACGLCIVSTNVGGIPYLLQADREALLVESDKPATMAEAVRRLLTDSDLSKQLSSCARRKAEQFDWSIVLPRWEQVLSSVMQTDDYHA